MNTKALSMHEFEFTVSTHICVIGHVTVNGS